jgi:putative oxidoreductase
MSALLAFAGRLLIALLFIISGLNKIIDPASTQAMLGSVGLPASFALPTGLFELVAGLALVVGFFTRFFATLLAIFCLVSAFFFHNNFVDPAQLTQLLKNVAIAGGLLCLCAANTMRWSYDSMRDQRRVERAEREAALRAAVAEGKLEERDAALRVAQAEGRVQGSTLG